jgi:hypothetical protein
MTRRSETELVLDAFLAPEHDRLADRVLQAAFADIARTPQRRALRAPWRFPLVRSRIPATGFAAVAFVLVVGAAGLLYLDTRPPRGPGGPSPTSSRAPSPTQVAPGITGWNRFTSAIYGSDLAYPSDWSVRAPATRPWRAGDVFPPRADKMPYADTFISPEKGDAQIGLIVWTMRADEGAVIESVEGLKAWADAFCNDVLRYPTSCEGFTQQAVPWAWDNGNAYTSAILVKTPGIQYAFLADCRSCLIVGGTDWVTVVAVAREDGFPQAARYGGSVALLRSILTTMNIQRP